MKPSFHTPHRHPIELPLEHAGPDALVDRCGSDTAPVLLTWRRLKKRGLVCRRVWVRWERELHPQEPA